MKLIEAMKELKLLEKKMVKNQELIMKYSAQPSSDRLYFQDKETQSKEVRKLIQSNHDLADRYLKIKIAIEKTNLETVIEFAGRNVSIAELLIYKRKMAKQLIETYNSLDDRSVQVGISRNRMDPGERTTVERFYTEEFKNANLRKWMDFYEGIDSRLEVVNATTELIVDVNPS